MRFSGLVPVGTGAQSYTSLPICRYSFRKASIAIMPTVSNSNALKLTTSGQLGGGAVLQQARDCRAMDPGRNRQIIADILEVVGAGRTPLVLTSRKEHLERLLVGLSSIEHVITLKGGMGKKQRQAAAEKLASIPDGVPRVILATGSYIGEGFDDSRLDTLFLTMPISWRGTLQQYVGRLHRIHDGKKVVRVYDYVDAHVPMLARMYEKRLKGSRAIGYELEGEPENDADV